MSSSEKKPQSVAIEKEQQSARERERETEEAEKVEKHANKGYWISTSAAYQIATATALNLQSHTKSIVSFRSVSTNAKKDLLEEGGNNVEETKIPNSEMASLIVTTGSITAGVGGKEEMKQLVVPSVESHIT